MDYSTVLPVVAIMLVTGLAGGILAGMLGVGGGIIIVPVLEFALQFAGVPDGQRMHVAIATSLATIVPTSISSTRAHQARGAIDWPLARSWALAVVAGATLGSLLAARASPYWLTAIFGVVALAVGAKMFLPLDDWRLASVVPQGVAGSVIGSLLGGLSAVMGIGGGTLAVPTLTLCGKSIHRAVATSAFFGLLISVPGTIIYMLARPPAALPALTIGYVSLFGLLLIAPGSWLTAPWGARLAHALSKRQLARVFGAFLLVVAARMLYRSWTGVHL